MRQVVDKLLETLLWIILAVMSLLVGANVFCRFVLNQSLYWGDEVAQILLVWLTFLGAAIAVREDQHYYLNYLSRMLTGRARCTLAMIRHAASVAAILILLYYSSIVSLRVHDWIMPATEISRALVYGACPLGSCFMLYYALAKYWVDKNCADQLHTEEPLGEGMDPLS
jgi:TRAP-type C4-dicarboxylate transport system permease small subunit